jgi:hypothetical protein
MHTCRPSHVTFEIEIVAHKSLHTCIWGLGDILKTILRDVFSLYKYQNYTSILFI